MFKWTLAISPMLLAAAWASLPISAYAQQAIPQAVIDECKLEASADKLPECLKEGSIALILLDLAATEEYYGDFAEVVVDICRDQNRTFSSTWVCFRTAAEKAAETAELIGYDNISDACVAGISDPDALSRMTTAWRDLRQELFPDEFFYGVATYMPFRGCDE